MQLMLRGPRLCSDHRSGQTAATGAEGIRAERRDENKLRKEGDPTDRRRGGMDVRVEIQATRVEDRGGVSLVEWSEQGSGTEMERTKADEE